ncbi:DUF4257 domain-containing protein [Mangrovibacillus cuniculi]|uniref:DUF4257 domain-containing protein n=1 Tax=Mangrovibacillus cuniculi TaxID=2593652 RepID=A0A7S8CDQ0_9BACI|nr:DUF4257 domain-containing protein [Mangrovibacillus cuniculi]QPC48099.1 DUF4257 domain-containing protein [Mangrovibacillus cuniculi]
MIVQHVLLASGIGLLMGMFIHVRVNGKLKKPRNTKKFFYPGCLEDMFWGAVAGALLVIVSDPADWWRSIFLGIIGGYSGEQIVRQFEYHKILNREVPDAQPTPKEAS